MKHGWKTKPPPQLPVTAAFDRGVDKFKDVIREAVAEAEKE